MKHRVITGEVGYRRRDGTARGKECFRFDVMPSGQRTMQTVSEIYDSQILRHVTYTVDERFRPLDAAVRVSRGGEFIGSAWFRFGDFWSECESWTAAGGRVSQRIENPVRPPAFGPHPVVADCWVLAAFDLTGPRVQRFEPIQTSSPEPDGSSGPLLSPLDLSIELVGEEEVTVAAGSFSTRHFRFLLEDLPPEDLWVTADYTLVRIDWEVFQTTYELERLQSG